MYRLEGGRPLRGELAVQGSKNSCLPILAAALLVGGKVVLHRCPDLADTRSMAAILEYLGCRVLRSGGEWEVDTSCAFYRPLPAALTHSLRSSSIFMGALLGRFGRVKAAYPGGCDLGRRPLDYHLSGFERLGAVCRANGSIEIEGPRLTGAVIELPFPSVGATQNLLLAAVAAQGETVLRGAAREPEVVDLIQFLTACGAQIAGMGTGELKIQGGRPLHGCEYTVMVDRIAAATYLCMGALCGGEIALTNTTPMTLYNILPLFQKMGCELDLRYDRVGLRSTGKLRGLGGLVTAPHPGLPTDIQPLLTAVLAAAQGETEMRETVFENRFAYLPQLRKLGAEVELKSPRLARIPGGSRYTGGRAEAVDLRGGAALCIAALRAGQSEIGGIEHILRGYEQLDRAVQALGGRMEKV